MKPETKTDKSEQIPIEELIEIAKKNWYLIGPILKVAWRFIEPQLRRLFTNIKTKCQKKKKDS